MATSARMHGWSNRVAWWAFARQYAEPCERAGGFSTNQGIFAADAAAHTRSCIANVRTVLAEYGLDLSHVVDVQCFLVDMKRDFVAFNAEYSAVFGALPAPPTRTTVEVAALPPGGRIAVELKVIARYGESASS